jgi:hypothetical protein
MTFLESVKLVLALNSSSIVPVIQHALMVILEEMEIVFLVLQVVKSAMVKMLINVMTVFLTEFLQFISTTNNV